MNAQPREKCPACGAVAYEDDEPITTRELVEAGDYDRWWEATCILCGYHAEQEEFIPKEARRDVLSETGSETGSPRD